MDKPFPLSQVPGCIFKYNGNIPESAYIPTSFNSPLEKAVYENDNDTLTELINSGHKVTVHLKIGEMSCFEFASLKGYRDVLSSLLRNSPSKDIIRKYFLFEDMTDRANMLSRDKESFFGSLAVMAEINRYVASLYNAVAFNRPNCLKLMTDILGKRDLTDAKLILGGTETFSAINYAQFLGHQECTDILHSRLNRSEASP